MEVCFDIGFLKETNPTILDRLASLGMNNQYLLDLMLRIVMEQRTLGVPEQMNALAFKYYLNDPLFKEILFDHFPDVLESDMVPILKLILLSGCLILSYQFVNVFNNVSSRLWFSQLRFNIMSWTDERGFLADKMFVKFYIPLPLAGFIQ